jgi:hypothetical protein
MIKKYSLAVQLLEGIGIGLLLLIGCGYGGRIIWRGTDSADLPPAVTLDRTEWDFGKVSSGQILHAEFQIGNAGGRRLVLRRSDGSCDCVFAREAEILVDPGKRRSIFAELDSTKTDGQLRMELDYRTNDPQQPLIKLLCTADVR